MHLLTCCANLSAPGSNIQHSREHRAMTDAPLSPGGFEDAAAAPSAETWPHLSPWKALGLPGATVMCPLSRAAPEASGVSFRPFVHPEQAEA